MFTRKMLQNLFQKTALLLMLTKFPTNFWQKRHVLLDERIMLNLDKQFMGRRIECIYQFGGFELISSGD